MRNSVQTYPAKVSGEPRKATPHPAPPTHPLKLFHGNLQSSLLLFPASFALLAIPFHWIAPPVIGIIEMKYDSAYRHRLGCPTNFPASPREPEPMLKISASQMQIMGHAWFIGRLMEVLRLAFPEDPPQDTPEFRQKLEDVIGRAHHHAISQNHDVARYVSLAYMLGTDFDSRFPAARSILEDQTCPANERLTLLEFWADQMVKALQGKN